MKLNVLILDDEERITTELSEYLVRQGFEVTTVDKPSQAFSLLAKVNFDILILDVRLPEMDGIQVLKQVKQDYPTLEVIMISGHGDMDTVIDSMRHGACDFLKKPFRQNDLKIAIERTARYVNLQKKFHQLKDDNSLISRELEEKVQKEFVGESNAIKKVLSDTLHIAGFPDTPVIISGESGTGKEIIARLIHYASPRKAKKFCPINCAALPDNLLESEFFGYKRGAFTGAIQDKKGFLELSEGGTIFLDEIGDMPGLLQSKLLRVLEEKKYLKLGSSMELPVNVRFVAATNRNLEQQISTDSFRLDLFYRLAAVQIHIPALRERPDDIEPLIRYFVNRFCTQNKMNLPEIDPVLLKEIAQYHFPGNVRELRNLVERALIINRDGILSFDDFPVFSGDDSSPESSLDKLQINQIRKVLEECGNNQSQAAKVLGISRYTLIRKLRKYGM